MPTQFIVPQFIDVEDKILGPISVRQFITILVGAGFIVGFYQLLYKLVNSAVLFFISALGVFLLTMMFAFFRVNGRPFHLFLLNLMESLRNPSMRLWNNMAAERIQYRREPSPPAPPPTKAPLVQTNLAHLAMLVDTGGAFHEDEDILYWGQTLPKSVKPNDQSNLPTE
jgi:hypothetical protein